MGLLTDIQVAILDDNASLSNTLLKLRFLSTKLGSHALDGWVSHELEGYSSQSDLPTYRELPVAYLATLGNGYQAIKNIPIPQAAVVTAAGERFKNFRLTQSLSAIERMIRNSDNGSIYFDMSNIGVMLQDQAFDDGVEVMSFKGIVSTSALATVQTSVKLRVLTLLSEIEKHIPEARDIAPVSSPSDNQKISGQVGQIINQVIHGNATTVNSSGENAQISLNVIQGSDQSVRDFLRNSGVPDAAAAEFSEILAAEQPDADSRPFGKRATEWIGDKMGLILKGGWKISAPAATTVLTEAAKKYYGL
ncbi:AbiTii domain-containing protein [Pseudogemmobacter bohemicus]|uniref:AbiTii domain-containing protein n=1 Tax=Pseudogemmobacter bohemicus TaxID=2250708 RepID=UPI0013008A0A|nr:hypothetical protein [Pseudogemmobacter bohemicus]